MRILFIADIVGKPGRAGLERAMPVLRERHSPDLVIANGENSAGGLGITEKTATELYAMGVDVITLGNHTYRHRDVYEYLDREERIVRPANYMKGNPGRGSTVVEAAGRRVGVINLSGQVQMRAARSPFPEVDVDRRPARGQGRRDLRRLPRRGHLGEGRDGLAPRRPRRGGGRHAHARPHRRRPGAPGRHRLHLRRRHDRLTRRRARRPLGAGARELSHPDCR